MLILLSDFNRGLGNCKYDVTTIICNSDEFYEGLVNWSYMTFLGREISNVQEKQTN